MDTDDRLRELIGAMQDEARARHGAPPAPEEILALAEGRLSEPERTRVKEGIASFPEAARLARALRRFPDDEPAPGESLRREAGASARWQELRRRLDEGGGAAGGEHEGARVGPRRRLPGVGWRLAATLVCGLALGALGTSLLQRPDARINLVPLRAVPMGSEGTRAGEARPQSVPESAGGLLLALPFAAAGDLPEYRLAIYDANGSRVWLRRGLVRSRQGPFYLTLPPGLLTSGRYRLELTDPADPSAPPLATYELRLEVE